MLDKEPEINMESRTERVIKPKTPSMKEEL
jgi:hypothetical protein